MFPQGGYGFPDGGGFNGGSGGGGGGGFYPDQAQLLAQLQAQQSQQQQLLQLQAQLQIEAQLQAQLQQQQQQGAFVQQQQQQQQQLSPTEQLLLLQREVTALRAAAAAPGWQTQAQQPMHQQAQQQQHQQSMQSQPPLPQQMMMPMQHQQQQLSMHQQQHQQLPLQQQQQQFQQQPPPPSSNAPGSVTRLFVAHAARASVEELVRWFGAYGPLAMPPEKHGAFAFVEFVRPEHAAAAMAGESGRQMGDRLLEIRPALSKDDAATQGRGHGVARLSQRAQDGLDERAPKRQRDDPSLHQHTQFQQQGQQPYQQMMPQQQLPPPSSLYQGGVGGGMAFGGGVPPPPQASGEPKCRIFFGELPARPVALALQNALTGAGIATDLAFVPRPQPPSGRPRDAASTLPEVPLPPADIAHAGLRYACAVGLDASAPVAVTLTEASARVYPGPHPTDTRGVLPPPGSVIVNARFPSQCVVDLLCQCEGTGPGGSGVRASSAQQLSAPAWGGGGGQHQPPPPQGGGGGGLPQFGGSGSLFVPLAGGAFMGSGPPPRACKFGSGCRQLLPGTCPYTHSTEHVAQAHALAAAAHAQYASRSFGPLAPRGGGVSERPPPPPPTRSPPVAPPGPTPTPPPVDEPLPPGEGVDAATSKLEPEAIMVAPAAGEAPGEGAGAAAPAVTGVLGRLLARLAPVGTLPSDAQASAPQPDAAHEQPDAAAQQEEGAV